MCANSHAATKAVRKVGGHIRRDLTCILTVPLSNLIKIMHRGKIGILVAIRMLPEGWFIVIHLQTYRCRQCTISACLQPQRTQFEIFYTAVLA